MMAAEHINTDLLDQMPTVRGRLRVDEPLARYTWFRVGGAADILFEPADADDLSDFMAQRPLGVPITVIGGTSNILIRDGGIPGVTVRLGKTFADISVDGSLIHAGGAAADINVARRARDAGLAGLEFLVGIPGTIGGALRMNAGAYGREIADVFESAEAIDGAGQRVQIDFAGMGFGYRHTDVPSSHIFVGATLRAAPGDIDTISARMNEIQERREATQPVRTRTGGSTFANPDGQKAWELIDAAGCRGLRVGDAMVSEEHCNFLINTANATAADLEALGEEVRRRVMETSGIDLHWEIRRLGVPAEHKLKEVTK